MLLASSVGLGAFCLAADYVVFKLDKSWKEIPHGKLIKASLDNITNARSCRRLELLAGSLSFTVSQLKSSYLFNMSSTDRISLSPSLSLCLSLSPSHMHTHMYMHAHIQRSLHYLQHISCNITIIVPTFERHIHSDSTSPILPHPAPPIGCSESRAPSLCPQHLRHHSRHSSPLPPPPPPPFPLLQPLLKRSSRHVFRCLSLRPPQRC